MVRALCQCKVGTDKALSLAGADTVRVFLSYKSQASPKRFFFLQTTVSMNSFIYAMAVFPEVLRKAQQEIDKVIGRERFPTFEDWESLPYTEAIMREILRWKPVLPLGVAHRVTEDDIYKGYLIPKGRSRDTAVTMYPLITSPMCSHIG